MQNIHRPVGLSTCGKDLTPALFGAYAAAGIEMAEISTATQNYPVLPYRAIGKWAKDAGVTLWSFHLPFVPWEGYNIANLDLSLRRGILALLGEYIKRAADLGIPRMVIHPSGEPIAPHDRPRSMELAKEGLALLSRVANEMGAHLCVEDLPRTCLGNSSAEILELLTADPSLTVCFDTNHLLGEPIADFVRAVGKKIETLHVSDYDFIDERHWLPGEGKIDWRELMDLLDEVEYKGAFLYELGFRAPRSVARPRPLTCEDFARNAAELEARAPLTVMGKAKDFTR